MNRTIFFLVADVFSAPSLLLLDSTVKGTAMLALATIATMILRRDSAATRHLVWLLAMVAILVVPVLSAILPGWQVLPKWEGTPPETAVVITSPPSLVRPAVDAARLPRNDGPVDVESPAAPAFQPAATLPDSRPVLVTPQAIPAPAVGSWSWQSALSLVWAIGCSMLFLRLTAARCMLWNTERQGTAIGSPSQPALGRSPMATQDSLLTALEAACLQLGMHRPVTLMIHPDKTIPVVWGIFRYRLLLPAAARHWSAEQLNSVLLHELAHIKRRDTLAQLLGQIACALYWFNPLVWFAAWRLGVERERACDDLVLASGVRPSAYAAHLLAVVTTCSPARWTRSCGLAMARQSSLESRLVAVLSEKQSRRGVSVTLSTIALVTTVAIAVPLAMLRAGDERPAAPVQQQGVPKPKDDVKNKTPASNPDALKQEPKGSAKLEAGVEERVKWGDPVNGLRAALVIRKSQDEPNAADTLDLYLLVQNVSDAPIRLNDATAPTLRYLTVQRDDVPQGRTKIEEPTMTDVLLQPHEATFLLMCPRATSRGQNLTAGMLKEPHMILFGQMNIEKAPAGAWTGKLVTGLTNGTAAQIEQVSKAGDPPAPKATKLKAGTEEKLEWGEPVKGLRMALVWPPALGEPAAGEVADFYLAVQNVSKEPVRLCTKGDTPDERWLDLKDKGRILFRISSKEPTGADVTLQPREVVFLRLFMEAQTQPDAVSGGAGIASDVRQSPNYRLKASLKLAKAPEGAWSGTLVTPDTRAGVGAEAPKNRKAQELFKVWLNRARLSGKIPGGFIARLGEHVQDFVKGNAADVAGAPYAKRMEPLLPRLDGKRDWQPVDAASLLNDIAAVSDAPLTVMLDEIAGGKVQHGLPFKSELEKLPWGEPVGHGIGLRTATLVGPGIESKLQYVDWIGNVVTEGRAASDKAGVDAAGSEIRLGTALGCRTFIHNAGKEPVVFRTRTWHHIEPTAKDARGGEIGMESITRYTRALLVTFRLEPDRYIELAGPGFGLGKRGFHDFKNADIASWIGAKEGDGVTLTPGLLPLHSWNEVEVLEGEPRWWLDFIIARLNLVTPLPADAAERKDLLNKAMSDLFRQDIGPTEAETAAFLRDMSPEALTNLAMRLHHRTDLRAWAGPLQSGPTRFRVIAADPKAPKPPEGPAAAVPPAPADKPAAAPAGVKPKGKEAQSLFKVWQDGARANGKIPGGALGSLARVGANFVNLNPTDERAPKIAELLKRIDMSRDWTQAEAVALLDDVSAIYAPLPSWAEGESRFRLGGAVQAGKPLPAELKSAPWGEAQPNGLRVAWLLDPNAEQHRLGTPLKSRILFHNAGKNVVLFRALTWNQSGAHKARDAKGAEINIIASEWTTIPRIVACRLAADEFLEVTAAGIGVGTHKDVENRREIRVGAWVEAKVGDEVTFTPAPVSATGNFTDERAKGEPGWWLDFIKDRLSLDSPLPADAAERGRLLNRAVRDLYGTAPTPEESAAFVADRTPDAFDALAKRLAERTGTSSFTGKLQSGETKFRVVPVADAAK